jgi:hypothetical protein
MDCEILRSAILTSRGWVRCKPPPGLERTRLGLSEQDGTCSLCAPGYALAGGLTAGEKKHVRSLEELRWSLVYRLNHRDGSVENPRLC